MNVITLSIMFDRKTIPGDILVVIILVILTAVFILIPPLGDTWVRTVLGLPMVLFTSMTGLAIGYLFQMTRSLPLIALTQELVNVFLFEFISIWGRSCCRKVGD